MYLELPRHRKLLLDRPVIVGVLNVTPDSFSDGGEYLEPDAAVARARAMIEAGADVIDIGGESTRPGASRVDARRQIARTVPVIEAVAHRLGAMVSIDTTRAEVAEAALDAGAAILNDVSAGRDDEAMLPLAAARGAPIVLMHMQGEPATMQHNPTYDDVVAEARAFLIERRDAAVATGIRREQIILDPGIGFGKTFEHNLQLLGNLDALVETGQPVLLGASRKRFLERITGLSEAAERDPATGATTAMGVMAGVHLFRVHEPAINRQIADVTYAAKAHRNG